VFGSSLFLNWDKIEQNGLESMQTLPVGVQSLSNSDWHCLFVFVFMMLNDYAVS
jgi:hypothetical protein